MILDSIVRHIIRLLNGSENDISETINIPYAESVAGLVTRVGKRSTPTGKTAWFPMVCSIGEDKCSSISQNPLIPSPNRKSILYFEPPESIRKVATDDTTSRYLYHFSQTIKLVHWYNKNALGIDKCAFSANDFVLSHCAKIGGYFKGITLDGILFAKLELVPGVSVDLGRKAFSKYTYDEIEPIVYVSPFESYSMGIKIDFSISKNCLPEMNIVQGSECNLFL